MIARKLLNLLRYEHCYEMAYSSRCAMMHSSMETSQVVAVFVLKESLSNDEEGGATSLMRRRRRGEG